MRPTDCDECVLEGRAAMDADNELEPEGAASLAPALEKMPQLTSLNLQCARTRFWARPRGVGVLFLWCVPLGTRLDAVWSGWGMRLRAGGRCRRRIARCVREGRAAMDADNYIGPEVAASLAPAPEKMPQLTSLDLGCARIRFLARPRGVGGAFFFGAWCWVRAWMRCGVVGVQRLRAGDAADGLRGVCLRGGRRWVQTIRWGLRGRHRWRRRSRRCRSSPRSTSDVRGFAFGRGLGGLVVSFSLVRGVGYALGCGAVWLGYALCGRAMRATDCEVCAEGRAAMDAVNDIGREGVASLAPALEKMPQLTSLDLGGARIRFWARPRGVWGSLSLVRGIGYALGCDVVWLGCALEGGRCGRRFARCVLKGRAAMDAGNELGPEGAASLAPALEKMPQLTSLDLGGARIRLWARPSGAGGSLSLVRAVGYALGCDVVWLGYSLEGGGWGRRIARCDCEVCAEGAGGDGCRQSARA